MISVIRTTLVVAAVVAVTACGDDGGGGDGAEVASLDDPSATSIDGSTPTTTPTDIEDALVAYTECMREHGVDVPDPQVNGEGGAVAIDISGDDVDIDELKEAEEVCGPIMRDAVGDLDIDPERQAEMEAEMLEFAECMREHGIDMPDPQFADDGSATIQADSFGDGDQDALDAANEACAPDGMFTSAAPGGRVESGDD